MSTVSEQTPVSPALQFNPEQTATQLICQAINTCAKAQQMPELFVANDQDPVNPPADNLLIAVYKNTETGGFCFQALDNSSPASQLIANNDTLALIAANQFPLAATDKSFLITCTRAKLFITHVAANSYAKAIIDGKATLLDAGWHVHSGDFDLDFGENRGLAVALQTMAAHFGKSTDEMAHNIIQLDLRGPIVSQG